MLGNVYCRASNLTFENLQKRFFITYCISEVGIGKSETLKVLFKHHMVNLSWSLILYFVINF